MQTVWDSNLLAMFMFELITKNYQFLAKVLKELLIFLFRTDIEPKSLELENFMDYQKYVLELEFLS